MKKLMMATALILGTTGAFAGDKGGNGGDVVVCPDSVRLLDHVEGESRGIYYNLADASVDYKYHLDEALDRIEVYSKGLAQKLEERIDGLSEDIDKFRKDIERDPEVLNERVSLYENTSFTTDNLMDIPDSQHVSLPAGCSIKQIVVQKKPKYRGERLYTIDKKLLVQLDEASLAGLVLHEVLYTDYIQNNWSNNSKGVRSLNTIISSDVIEGMDLQAFINELGKVGYKQMPIESLIIRINSKGHVEFPKGNFTLPVTGKIEGKFTFNGEWSGPTLNYNGDWRKNPIKKIWGFGTLKPVRGFNVKNVSLNMTYQDGSLVLDNKAASNLERYQAASLFGVDWENESYGLGSYGKCKFKRKTTFFGNIRSYLRNGYEEKKIDYENLVEVMTSGFCD